jgi:hypothetical protein
LLSIQCHSENKEEMISDFMTLCRDILVRTIHPYNIGWMAYEEFKQVEEE